METQNLCVLKSPHPYLEVLADPSTGDVTSRKTDGNTDISVLEAIPICPAQPSRVWLHEYSIAARKLTLRDSLDPTAVHVKGKYIKALKKTVYPKVFDEAFSYFYRLRAVDNRDEVKVYVFPEAARLKDYLVCLEYLLDVYKDRLVVLVGANGRYHATLIEQVPTLANVDIHKGVYLLNQSAMVSWCVLLHVISWSITNQFVVRRVRLDMVFRPA